MPPLGRRQFVRGLTAATAAGLVGLSPLPVQAEPPPETTRIRIYALQTMSDVPYGRWVDYDAVDTMRFYALRLHEAGMIKSSPQKIIDRGTNWRFLNEVKKELKT